MTAFDQPFNPGRTRGGAPQAGRQGIQVQANAPGTVALPPTSRQGSRLRQMVDAIGAAGRLGNTAASIASREIRNREFEQQKFDRLYEAKANLDARTRLATIQQEIADGKHVVPEGVDVGEYAAELARIQLPDDAPDAYKSRYQSILVPTVAEQITRKQANDIAQARAESIQVLAEGAFSSAGTVEDMLAFVEQAKQIDPNLSDREARQAVLLPALQVAIEQGDKASFDVIARALGTDFATTIARGRIQVENQRLRNDNQRDAERMREATRIVDALANSPLTTDQNIRESIDNMDGLTSTDRQVLRSRLQNIRSEQIAAERSERRQLIESIEDRAETPSELRSALEINAEALGLNDRQIEQEVLAFARSEIELAANRGNLDRIDELAPFVGDGPDAQLLLDEARSVAVNVKRDERFKTVVTGLQAGELDPDTIRAAVTEDAQQYLQNPNSPDVFTPAQRDSLMRAVGSREQRDLSVERVMRVLNGDGRAVITSDDDDTIDAALGPAEEGGTGLIDANNNITDPQRLGASVAALNRVTPNTRDIVMTNLMRGQPDQRQQAMQTLAVISQARPGLIGEFAGEDDLEAGMVLAEIRIMNDRGVVANQPQAALERITALTSELSDTPINRRQVDQQLSDDNVNIDKEISEVMERAAKLMPWKDPSMAPFNEAGLVDANEDAIRYLANRYRELYYYQRHQGRSKKDANKFAQRTAQELLVRNYDFIRFNGEMHVQRIDDGVNRLPEDYRWSDDYHTEIEKYVEGKGYDKDDVFTVRPSLIPGSPGWMLIDQNLDPLTNEDGLVLLWEPPARLRDQAIQNRELLEEKALDFEQDKDRTPHSRVFEGLDPATIQAIP